MKRLHSGKNKQKLCDEIDDTSAKYLESQQKLNGGKTNAKLWILTEVTDKLETEKPRASKPSNRAGNSYIVHQFY